MKKEWIITGKTVEEARKKAAEELKLPQEDLVITVLDEGKRGFLGIGAVDARISVSYTVKGEDNALAFVRRVGKKEGSNNDVVITVDGENAGVLIGHHGDTMDALQYLANLVANKKTAGEKSEYVKITMDVAGYRAKRETALRALARRMAAKVLKYKKSVMFEPMNPYERRIIHSEAQTIAGVSTNSIGSENNRRVVMYLDDGKDVPSKQRAADAKESGSEPASEEEAKAEV